VHPLKSPNLFSQSKFQTTNTLLYNFNRKNLEGSSDNNNNNDFNNSNNGNLNINPFNIPGFIQYNPNLLHGNISQQMLNYHMMDHMNHVNNNNQYSSNVNINQANNINNNVNNVNRNNLFQINANYNDTRKKLNQNQNQTTNFQRKAAAFGKTCNGFNNTKPFGKFMQNKPKSAKSDQHLNFNLKNLQNKLTREIREENTLEKLDSFIKKQEILNTVGISSENNKDNSLMVINIKTETGTKSLKLTKNDNILLLATNFCKEHSLSDKFIKPIVQMINKALSSLQDVLFNNDLVESDIESICHVIDQHNREVEDSQSTNADEGITNISCFTVLDEYERDSNDEDILNKTL
jgi:hypothetical protein